MTGRERMENRKWIRLDNASNIFIAARNDTDTKVFRMTAEMTDTINHVSLQNALENVYEEYPLFHNVLRRGFFWYYLEPTEKKPKVSLETAPPCSPIYHYDRREFLFRVLFRHNQIHLEVFHALTDGTGAMWFFEDLLTEYVNQQYLEDEKTVTDKNKREKQDLEDSFTRYFGRKNRKLNFSLRREPMENLHIKQEDKQVNFFEKAWALTDKVYHVKGERTPDHRLRIINLQLPVEQMLKLARQKQVSLTIYTTALYILSVYEAKSDRTRETTISVSIPINLRQLFPSLSVRNFFSTTTVGYTFKENEKVDLKKICLEIDQQFKKKLEAGSLEQRLKQLTGFEYNPFIRIIPRPLKDLLLNIINRLNNRQITLAMSNLGIVSLPPEMKSYVQGIHFYTSVIRPQFCMISYGDFLNISFTSPFTETITHQNFVQYLSNAGVDVVADVNKVTKEEFENE